MRSYDITFKNEAVKLGKEVGLTKAARELNIPSSTLETWMRKSKNGTLPGGDAKPHWKILTLNACHLYWRF